MGYGTRNGSHNQTIQTFWPDDTDMEFYLESDNGYTLEQIKELIEEKWPGSSLADITITCEEINTDCLGYDLYDPIDYTDFIVIRKTNGA